MLGLCVRVRLCLCLCLLLVLLLQLLHLLRLLLWSHALLLLLVEAHGRRLLCQLQLLRVHVRKMRVGCGARQLLQTHLLLRTAIEDRGRLRLLHHARAHRLPRGSWHKERM